MKKLLFLILLVPTVLAGCASEFSTNSLKNTTGSLDEYISLTTTDMNYKNYYYSFELESYNTNEVLITDDTSQYPLGVIDFGNDEVYYTYRIDGADQIMSYNIEEKSAKKITSDLFATNQIIPVDRYLYLVSTTNRNNMLQLLKFDTKTNSYITITDDETMVSDITYCKSNNSIYFISYNWNDQIALNEKFEKFPEQYPEALSSTNTISKYDCNSGEITKIFEDDISITKISMYDDNIALIKSSATLFSPKLFYLVSFSDNEVIEQVDFGDMVRIDNYSFGNKGLYFTGIANPDKNFDPNSLDSIAPPNALYFMDINSREVTQLASFEDKFINNFVVFE